MSIKLPTDDELEFMKEKIIKIDENNIIYYYKGLDGEVFSCISCTENEARELRDNWLRSKLGY